jgi:hypothetical protein
MRLFALLAVGPAVVLAARLVSIVVAARRRRRADVAIG